MKHKIVFVDDEPSMVSALKRMFANEPFDVYGFNSPIQALEQIEDIAPQVILSDQRMPEMHGIHFLGKVREKLPDTVRIILTGFCMPDYAQYALKSGDVSKFMSKPWDRAALIHEIHSAFSYFDSTKARIICWCDICGTKCTAETIQIHNSLQVCIQCKKRVESLPIGAAYNLARFFNGNVL